MSISRLLKSSLILPLPTRLHKARKSWKNHRNPVRHPSKTHRKKTFFQRNPQHVSTHQPPPLLWCGRSRSAGVRGLKPTAPGTTPGAAKASNSAGSCGGSSKRSAPEIWKWGEYGICNGKDWKKYGILMENFGKHMGFEWDVHWI